MKSLTDPSRPHRLKILWIHWVLANAAGLGTYAAAVGVTGHGSRNSDDIMRALAILVIVGGIGCIGSVQKVVLRGAGLEVSYWALLTYPGLFAGGAATIIPMTLLVVPIQQLPTPLRELTILVGGTFTYGFVFGVVQSLAVTWTWKQMCYWSIGSGLGVVAAAGAIVLFEAKVLAALESRSIGVVTLAMTAAGALYGAVTGVALVWLVPASSVAPSEQRGSAS